MPIASAKITSKGQITLPAKLRRELGLKPGDRVSFQRNSNGKIEMTAKTGTLMDLRGILKGDRKFAAQEIVDIVAAARTARADQIVARMRARNK